MINFPLLVAHGVIAFEHDYQHKLSLNVCIIIPSPSYLMLQYKNYVAQSNIKIKEFQLRLATELISAFSALGTRLCKQHDKINFHDL